MLRHCFLLISFALCAAPAVAQTAPVVLEHHAGPALGSGGVSLYPSAGAAVGPTKVFVSINSGLSEYQKAPFTPLGNVLLSTFFASGAPTPFDTHVVYDQHSGRWFVTATTYDSQTSTSHLWLAVSTSSTPTLASGWFKTSILLSQGVDSGHIADGGTLAVDARGVYATFIMFPNTGQATSTILALDKAPLIAASPSLGAVTAFRDLLDTDLIQPCDTFGDPGVEYMVSAKSGNSLLVRAVVPPLSAPTLVTIGSMFVPVFAPAPTASALGSANGVRMIVPRLTCAVFRNGSIWTTHCISLSNNASVRWYEVDPTSLVAPLQTGTITSATRDYYFPSLAVNAFNDVALGFSGSSSTERIGVYSAGRLGSDPPGATSAPALIIAQPFAWSVLTTTPQPWGIYSTTCTDGAQELWTFQQYTSATNAWTVRAARLRFAEPSPTSYCTGKTNSAGCTPAITSSGTPDTSGANDFVIRCQNVLMAKSGLLFYGSLPLATAFQGGWLCVRSPTTRTPAQLSPSGGADCGATIQYSFAFDTHIRSGFDPALVAGQRVYAQWWMRDPASASTTGLSNALYFGIAP